RVGTCIRGAKSFGDRTHMAPKRREFRFEIAQLVELESGRRCTVLASDRKGVERERQRHGRCDAAELVTRRGGRPLRVGAFAAPAARWQQLRNTSSGTVRIALTSFAPRKVSLPDNTTPPFLPGAP